MEGLIGIGAVILGILLRFGIPVLCTALLIWLLRKLDQRWQREGTAYQSKTGLKELPIFGDLRCWVTNDCTPEQRERCPAVIEAVRPCWQVYRDGDGVLKERCLDCEVFKNAPIPVPA